MAALEPLYHLFEEPQKKLSKIEILFMEVILFLQLEPALNKNMNNAHAIYEGYVNNNQQKENMMIENNFVRNLIEDILSTEEYSLAGIAFHLNLPEEVLSDILIGYNQSPSLSLARKIMELHKYVRRDLYHHLIKKIAMHASQSIVKDELL